jgi:glycoprotein endo-alpha-1,2-mannosidase
VGARGFTKPRQMLRASLLLVSAALARAAFAPASPADRLHAFFYLWYGNPAVDGNWSHWDHHVLPHWTPSVAARFPPPSTRWVPPDDIHAPFYPARGPYSSRDAATLDAQLAELRGAGVGVVVASWWGRAGVSGGDSQGVLTDGALRALLDAAARAPGGPRVALHLEPYAGRDAASVAGDLAHLAASVGAHAGLARDAAGRAIFYVYDSYHIPPAEWARLLTPGGDLSVRGGAADGAFFGLWLSAGDGAALAAGGFDGAYTYFASPAVGFGADPAHWPAMAREAAARGLAFSPTVAPGYDDSKIRPWNAAATRTRAGGAAYRDAFDSALAVEPAVISICSFNEWGEGTQIEPAVPRTVDVDALAPLGRALARDARAALVAHDAYDDYGPGGPSLYLDITRAYAARLAATPPRGAAPAADAGRFHADL